MTSWTKAVEAANEHDVERLSRLLDADPTLLRRRGEDEYALLDHALWALLVGDWSRPPTVADDPEGRGLATVAWLLDRGADVNGLCQDGYTPLHTALYQGHVELTTLLLDRGADPRAEVYGAGGTPLTTGLFWGHADAADVLAERDVWPVNLRVAAGLGRAQLIDSCFDGAALTTAARANRAWYRPHTDFPEWTPADEAQEVLDEALAYAVRNRRTTVYESLVQRGADVDGVAYNGAPLHWAASGDDLASVSWLLDHGADPNRRASYGTQDGVTPLHCAAWLDRVDAARLLLDRGADPTIEDATYHSTPLGWAEYLGSPGVAALLSK